jgi:hypothetical protein
MDPLESRVLLSREICFPNSECIVIPSLRLPRTGGVAIQAQTLLSVGVGQRTLNSVQVTDDGAGTVSAKWNGRPPRSFTGVTTTVVQADRAKHDKIIFRLTGSQGLAITSTSGTPAVRDRATGEAAPFLRAPRLGVAAVQSGTLLTITVTARKIRSVGIVSVNSGALVQTEWNGGGAVAQFDGVRTIIVNIKNGTNQVVGLRDLGLIHS